MDVGCVSLLKSYFKKYIYIVQRKPMVEDAQQKFTVGKARSWEVFQAKVHNLIVQEKKKN